MFVVLLKFAADRDRAGQFVDGHKDWIAQGFADGVFLAVGSLQPDLGGAVVAHGVSRADLDARVAADPFVAEKVVTAEILEITPARVDPRLDFLTG